MARLKEQVDLIVGWMRQRHPDVSFGDQCAREMEDMIRRAMPGEKVYVPAPDMSKRAAIEEACRMLPTAVVAERLGVHQSWVRKLSRGVTRRK